MKTFSLKAGEISKKWFIVDAKDLVLGRLASFLAVRLRGKHLPTFCPHMDCGDNIIVINAKDVHLTGNNKADDKKFYWHTGYPGGIKEKSIGEIRDGRFPERVIQNAVRRMITRGPLGRRQMLNLKVYPGPTHPHAAQNPAVLDFGSFNRKNIGSSARKSK